MISDNADLQIFKLTVLKSSRGGLNLFEMENKTRPLALQMDTWLQKVLLLEFVQSDSTETQTCGKRRSSLTRIVFFLRTVKDAIHMRLFLSLLGHGTASVCFVRFYTCHIQAGRKFLIATQAEAKE